VAAVATTVAVQPLDVIKTTFQKDAINHSKTKNTPNYIQTIKSIPQLNQPSTRFSPLTSYYRGLTVSLFRAVPGISYYLSLISYISPIAQEKFNGKISDPIVNLICASSVRASASVLFLPLTVQKTRRQGGLGLDFSKSNLIKHYKISLLPVTVRDAGQSGVYYAIYQFFKTEMNLSVSVSAFNAAILSTIITQPADVAISQRQIFNKKISYKQLLTSRVLLAGLVPRLIRRPISSTITWYTFETVKTRLSY